MSPILSIGTAVTTVSRDPSLAEDFAAAMARLGPLPARLAVAVSGGSDSMALVLLADDWAKARGGSVVALTVDHGLRPESAAEAMQVGRWLKGRHIDHHILTWHGPKPTSAIQDRARVTRYELMGRWCHGQSIPVLAVGHQLEDQAETLLLRLRQGSGLDGLAAMASRRSTPWVDVIRPVLGLSRERLVTALRQFGQDFIADPSNDNPRFERVRLRRMMADLSLSAPLLADLAQVMGQARHSMEALVDRAESLLVSHHCLGFAVSDGAGLAQLPREVGLRLLSRLVRRIGGAVYPPKSDRIERLLLSLSGTLAGCRLSPKADGILVLCRENRHMEPPKILNAGEAIIWDRRFKITAAADCPAPVVVGSLGAGVPELKLPAILRPGIPAIWYQEKVLCLPQLGYKSPDSACIFADSHYFCIEALRSA